MLHELPYQHYYTVEEERGRGTGVQRLWTVHEASWGQYYKALWYYKALCAILYVLYFKPHF